MNHAKTLRDIAPEKLGGLQTPSRHIYQWSPEEYARVNSLSHSTVLPFLARQIERGLKPREQ